MAIGWPATPLTWLGTLRVGYTFGGGSPAAASAQRVRAAASGASFIASSTGLVRHPAGIDTAGRDNPSAGRVLHCAALPGERVGVAAREGRPHDELVSAVGQGRRLRGGQLNRDGLVRGSRVRDGARHGQG